MAEAEAAAKLASRAAKDTVKGMRTVQRYEITSQQAVLSWMGKNDRDAVLSFIDDYVRRNFKTRPIDGVTVTSEKEAF
jgi:hypothetical protein